MTSEGKLLVSKEVLHKIRDLVTELRSIDPTVQVVSALNEAQKLVIEIEKLEIALPKAGFFKKRGIKKTLTQDKEKYNKLTEELLNALLVGFRKIYFDLANNIKEIAKFIPQETETIRKLQIPSFDTNEILRFSSNVLRTYNQISEVLRGKNVSILLFNREIIELYGKFVNFDEEKVRVSNQTTKTSIHVMTIPDLLEVYSLLEAENAYLKQRRKGTEGKIQLAIVQMSSELQQHIDTVASIGLDLWNKIDVLKEEVQDVQTSADRTTSVETLISLEKRLNSLSNEFINILRTYEISLKTETEDQIGRIIQIFGKEGLETAFSPVPETDISSTSIPTIIQDIEKIRSWRQQQIIATKKILSTSELINSSKAIRAMKIPVPPNIEKDVRAIEKEAAKTSDLQEWVELAKRYHDLKTALAGECQNYFFRLLENPHIQEVINLSEGPKIPTIRDFEALSPSELSS
ncbi:MAG: hypothetical protein ACFFDI_20650, partial [Promethearchaeota archaeon]